MATIDDFLKIDMRVGTVLDAVFFEKARKPAYKLHIDFGKELGIKQSSAQITSIYEANALVGTQVIAVVNFPPRRIAGFKSEVLVLGLSSDAGIVLLRPESALENGERVH